MGFLSTRVTQFSYFNEVLGFPAWTGRKILDFGGNIGGFLAGSEDVIRQENYWCLDLDRDAVLQGAQRYPDAHFIHYDRYHSEYNPTGIRNHPIPPLGSFDFILAFSVFTHIHEHSLIDLVNQLRKQLEPDGILAFTFCDPSYDRSVTAPALPSGTGPRGRFADLATQKSPEEIEGVVERAGESRWCILIDDEVYLEPGSELSDQERVGRPGESYCTYYQAPYMTGLFPGCQLFDPVPPEWQHCCVL